MPLKSGKENIGDNIKELKKTGKYPNKQILAIVLNKAEVKPQRNKKIRHPKLSD